SGPMLRAIEPERAASTTAGILAKLGVSTVEALRALPVEDIVAAQEAALGGPLGNLYGDGPRMAPMLDGEVLPAHPFDPIASPECAGVPLMIGTCKDESTLVMIAMPGIDDLDPESQVQMLADGFFGHAYDELLQGYAVSRPDQT